MGRVSQEFQEWMENEFGGKVEYAEEFMDSLEEWYPGIFMELCRLLMVQFSDDKMGQAELHRESVIGK